MDFLIEFTCTFCKGHGEICQQNKVVICGVCNGSGKVDWIQHIVERMGDPIEKKIKVSDKRRIR